MHRSTKDSHFEFFSKDTLFVSKVNERKKFALHEFQSRIMKHMKHMKHESQGLFSRSALTSLKSQGVPKTASKHLYGSFRKNFQNVLKKRFVKNWSMGSKVFS